MVYIRNVCPDGAACNCVRSGNAPGVFLKAEATDSCHQNPVDGSSICSGQLVRTTLQGQLVYLSNKSLCHWQLCEVIVLVWLTVGQHEVDVLVYLYNWCTL